MTEHTSTPANSESNPGAVWRVRHRWLTAGAVAIAPVVFTATGLGSAQARGADERTMYLSAAAAVSLCAVLGLALMWRARPTLAEFGVRAPSRVRDALWFIPAAIVPVLVFASTGYAVDARMVPGFAWLAIAAGVNEEVWYRGLLLSVFRDRGTRWAVVVSSALFGVLHLVNLWNGKSVQYALLQWAFATLFGFVAAELVAVTGSLWPVIVWHLVYDFTAYIGGDALSTGAMIALAVESALLIGYAVWLWRRLPR